MNPAPAAPPQPPGPAPAPQPGLRVLVLTGGVIHLVHQLAALGPEPAAELAVLITGVLTRDPPALEAMQATLETWFGRLREQDPHRFGRLHLVRSEAALPPGPWDLACLNNQWVVGQRTLVERLAIPRLLVCGDGLGVYYRCARELRAILPSLLGLPLPEPGRRVRYVLSGRQPRWHRPPQAAERADEPQRLRLLESLVACLAEAAAPLVAAAREAAGPEGPIWLCSVPNLAHQFPQRRLPWALWQQWAAELPGFDPTRQRLVPVDHPKAPGGGSLEVDRPAWLAQPLRSSIPLEVLVRRLEQTDPQRPIRVAGLTSALLGVALLTGAAVVWLPVAPLWRHNPGYRRKPLEYLHRWLRARRMRWITASCGRAPGAQ